MPRKKDDDLMGLLATLPWWVGVTFAFLVMIFIRFLLPHFGKESSFLAELTQSIAINFWWVGGVFFIPALISLIGSKQRAKLLESQKGLASIKNLSWREFECLVGEAFKRNGFSVTETGGGGADGGIDLSVQQGENRYLIQCKHWKTQRVGVKDIREFLGVITDAKVSGGYFITSGSFTPESIEFAQKNRITLYNGEELWNLIKDVQTQSNPSILTETTTPETKTTLCPLCQTPMILRTAKKGNNAGNNFWGCTHYPQCKGTRQI